MINPWKKDNVYLKNWKNCIQSNWISFDTQAIKKIKLHGNISKDNLRLRNHTKLNCVLEQTVSSCIQQNQHNEAAEITLTKQKDKGIT